jgi:hypothetical protein
MQVDDHFRDTIRQARVMNLVFGVVMAVLSVGLAVAALPIVQEAVTRRASPSGTIAFAASSVVCAIASTLVFQLSKVYAPPSPRLMNEGLRGVATLREVRGGRFSIESRSGVIARSKLLLDVSVEGRPPYAVAHETFILPRHIPRLRPGATLPVRVDPTRPSTLAVDWDAA